MTLFLDSTSTPKFDLITTSCVPDLAWVNLDATANGASSSTQFDFRSFRFPGSLTFHLHCTGKRECFYIYQSVINSTFLVYLCHDTETCTATCPAARRRRRALSESERAIVSNLSQVQSNGIPIAKVLSSEIIVPDDAFSFALESKPVRKTVQNLDERMKLLRKAVQSISGPIKRLKELTDTN